MTLTDEELNCAHADENGESTIVDLCEEDNQYFWCHQCNWIGTAYVTSDWGLEQL